MRSNTAHTYENPSTTFPVYAERPVADRSRSLLKGALAGAVAGLAAGYIMGEFQGLWSKLTEDEAAKQKGQEAEKRRSPEQSSDSTVKTAANISKTFGHRLTKKEAKTAGPAVHYAFSATMGALYGVLAEADPKARAGFGTVFGSGLFVGADEIMVPLLGLGKPVQKVPLSKHVYGWVSHLVYGASTEGIYRLSRAALGKI